MFMKWCTVFGTLCNAQEASVILLSSVLALLVVQHQRYIHLIPRKYRGQTPNPSEGWSESRWVCRRWCFNCAWEDMGQTQLQGQDVPAENRQAKPPQWEGEGLGNMIRVPNRKDINNYESMPDPRNDALWFKKIIPHRALWYFFL